MTSEDHIEPISVRFGRRQTKGVLLGLSGPRLLTTGSALAVLCASVLAAGRAGMLVSAPIWGGLAAAAFVHSNGEPWIESLPVRVHWSLRMARRQTRFVVRPVDPRPRGTMALPGDAAALRFHVDEVTGAVMVHDPHRQTLTAIVRVTYPSYVLLSPEEQARRVRGWSQAITTIAATERCACIQVLDSTIPDPGTGVRDRQPSHGVGDGSWAARQYSDLIELAMPSAVIHRNLIAVSLDLKRCTQEIRAAGRGIRGAASVLQRDMAGIQASLRDAALSIRGWLTPAELAVAIREAYDPTGISKITEGEHSLTTAGPVAIEEHWSYLRHDSAFSTVLWISEWPRIEVSPQFLHNLVFEPGVRKTVSLVATPLSMSRALRAIHKEKVEYLTEAHQNARIGRLADISAAQELDDVSTRERALVAGHVDMRFSGFVSVTAPTRDTLIIAISSIARAASQCGCQSRILHGQQAQAFVTAALPLARAVGR